MTGHRISGMLGFAYRSPQPTRLCRAAGGSKNVPVLQLHREILPTASPLHPLRQWFVKSI